MLSGKLEHLSWAEGRVSDASQTHRKAGLLWMWRFPGWDRPHLRRAAWKSGLLPGRQGEGVGGSALNLMIVYCKSLSGPLFSWCTAIQSSLLPQSPVMAFLTTDQNQKFRRPCHMPNKPSYLQEQLCPGRLADPRHGSSGESGSDAGGSLGVPGPWACRCLPPQGLGRVCIFLPVAQKPSVPKHPQGQRL